MNRAAQILFFGAVGVLVLGSGWAAFFTKASKQPASPPSATLDFSDLAPPDLRESMLKDGPDHDAYLFLIKSGTSADFPILLYGLSTFPEVKPDKDGTTALVCIQDHCLEALRAITRANPGVNYKDWVDWYEAAYRRPAPPWKPGEPLPELGHGFEPALR